jgi:Flp pilus assembly pilin Flp
MREEVRLRRRVPPRGDLGQGMMEYALVLALVSVAAIAALYFFGGSLNSLLGIGASAAPR